MMKNLDIQDIFNKIMLSIGENPNRDGLLDSLRRIVESYSEILDGYGKNPKKNF